MKVILMIITLLITTDVYAGTVEIGYEETNNDVSNSYTSSLDFSDEISDVVTLNGQYRYGETDDTTTKDDGSISIGYDPEINEKWGVWVDETIGYNKIIGIDYENRIGVGVRYYIMKNIYRKLSISGGLLYHYISDQEEGRYSWRLKYGDGVFKAIYFYQPSIEDNYDYISVFDSSIKIAEINDYLTMKIYYTSEYRSEIDSRYNNSGLKISYKY